MSYFGLIKIAIFSLFLSLYGCKKDAKSEGKKMEDIIKAFASSINATCVFGEDESIESSMQTCFLRFKLAQSQSWPIPKLIDHTIISSDSAIVSLFFEKNTLSTNLFPLKVNCSHNGRAYTKSVIAKFSNEGNSTYKVNMRIEGLKVGEQYQLECSLFGSNPFNLKLQHLDPKTYFTSDKLDEVDPVVLEQLSNELPSYVEDSDIRNVILGNSDIDDLPFDISESEKIKLMELKNQVPDYTINSTPIFDYEYYVKSNPVIKRLFQNNPDSIKRYWAKYGVEENDSGSETLNFLSTIITNPFNFVLNGEDYNSFFHSWEANSDNYSSLTGPKEIVLSDNTDFVSLISEIENEWMDDFGFMNLHPINETNGRLDNENPVLFTSELYFLLKSLGILE
ncbi:hypothetical protein OAB57_04010, partial [Bacteriovoracaceae bacterium]|nr:hypothetical protein [Bacteriovoracaceae bacterium]